MHDVHLQSHYFQELKGINLPAEKKPCGDPNTTALRRKIGLIWFLDALG